MRQHKEYADLELAQGHVIVVERGEEKDALASDDIERLKATNWRRIVVKIHRIARNNNTRARRRIIMIKMDVAPSMWSVPSGNLPQVVL